MIKYTKEDLDEIWCPEVRLIKLDNGKIMTNRGQVFNPNSDEDPGKFCKCIGSACASWDWVIHMELGLCIKGSAAPTKMHFERTKKSGHRESNQ